MKTDGQVATGKHDGKQKSSVGAACANYAAMLKIATASGSCIDQSTINFLASRQRDTAKMMNTMEKSTGDRQVAIALEQSADRRKRTLTDLQERVRKADQDARKEKKDKKRKKDSKNKEGEDKASMLSTLGASRMQVLPHLVPADTSIVTSVQTQSAKLVQKVCEPKVKPGMTGMKAIQDSSAKSSASTALVAVSPKGKDAAPPASMGVSAGPSKPASKPTSIGVSPGPSKPTSIGVSPGPSKPASSTSSSALVPSKPSFASPTTKAKSTWLPIGKGLVSSSTNAKELYAQAERNAKKHLAKEWQLGDFGQGNDRGGSQIHMRNRYESIIRLMRQSESLGHHLSSESMVRFPTWVMSFDKKHVANLPYAGSIGAAHANWLEKWVEAMKTDPSCFKKMVTGQISRLPPPRVLT